MAGINKVILLGRLGTDPEVKYLEGGLAVARLSVATSKSYTDRAGNKVEKTEWHRVVFFRRLAEIATTVKVIERVVANVAGRL